MEIASWLNIKKTSELIYVIFMTIYTVLALILRFPGITPEFCGDIDKTRFLQIVKYLLKCSFMYPPNFPLQDER